MTIIHLVTCGVYPDFSVVGAFSTQEAAQTFLDRWNTNLPYGTSSRLEEHVIDAGIVPSGQRLWNVWLRKNGDLEDIMESKVGVPSSGHWALATAYLPVSCRYQLSLWAEDEAAALRIARERMAVSKEAGELVAAKRKAGVSDE